MQIKATTRCHYTPIRMGKLKKNKIKNIIQSRDVEKLELSGWRESKMIKFWRMVWYFLLKLNIHQPYKPGVPILGILHRLKKNIYIYIYIHLYKDWYMNIHDSFTYFNQNMKITSMFIMKVYK